MGKKVCFLSIFAFMFLFFIETSMAQNMKEGLWEIAMIVEEPGEAPMKMNYTQCLTNKDYIPFKGEIEGETDKECKVVKFDFKGNVLTWIINCKGEEGPSTGTGKVTYKGETFEGVVKMKDPDGEMTIKLKGKWIGKCPGKK